MPRPNVGMAVGTRIAAPSTTAVPAADTRVRPLPQSQLWPRPRTHPTSHAQAQTASRITPGSTAGTMRRLAHGWSGVIDGRYRNVTIVHANVISGSVHSGA